MAVNQDYLRKYCELLVRTGANVQKGQNLMLSCTVETYPVARMLAEEAYKAGAREVVTFWGDAMVSRSCYLYAQDDSIFDEYHSWDRDKVNVLSKNDAALLSVGAPNPEAMKGVDLSRLMRAQKAAQKATKDYHNRIMKNEIQWCGANVPGEAWAKKVFPKTRNPQKAVDALWEMIFKASRIDDGDPEANWREHVAQIRKSAEALNAARFKALKYKNSLGTDLTVEMPDNHVWLGGGETSRKGVPFLANVPTEEIFSAPKRDGVNGVVVASMPLVYSGNVIDAGFSFTFKNGKVTGFDAKKKADRELIKHMLTVAKNMEFLGEVALVPHKSPISQMNTLFYSTLYDENASCHFALGQAYADCLIGGGELSDREMQKAGLNLSPDHRDFMVGTVDMSITGVAADGTETPVFVNGNFTARFE